MSHTSFRQRLLHAMQERPYLQGGLRQILIWPLISLAIGALMWGATFAKIHEDRRHLGQTAIKDVASLSHAYANHLSRAIAQADQLLQFIKFDWERSQAQPDLAVLLQKGFLPVSNVYSVSIADQSGAAVSFLFPFERPSSTSFAGRDLFLFHKRNSDNQLFTGQPVLDPVSGKTLIYFSRRLDTGRGEFAGVIVVAVEPAYFSAGFYDGSSLGKSALLAIAGQYDKVLRALRIGGEIRNASTDVALGSVPMREAPNGALFLPGDPWFSDTQARFVSWELLPQYPLVAVVGLSEQELLAPYRDSWQTYRTSAMVASIFLFLFGFIATLLTIRLAARKHLEDDARSAYRVATEGGNDGFYMLRAMRNAQGKITDFELMDCNEQGAAFYGQNRASFVGTKLSTWYVEPYFTALLGIYRHAMELGYYEDEWHVASDSPMQLKWIHRKFVRSGTGLAMTVRDINSVKTHERELARLANEDALTTLPNRYWMNNYLPAALARIAAKNGMLALLFIDLDDFKNVNDTQGHQVGDALLCEVAARLRGVLRPHDHVVRLGGDEFTLILEQVESENDAAVIAARVIDSLCQPYALLRGRSSIGASIGITLFPRDGSDSKELLKNADIAMYHAKAEGKGDFRFYQPILFENLKVRLDTERALLTALDDDQFVLFYEPRICTYTGELRALEALVRWVHPERGLVSPAQFIPLAEESGLILKLGEIVLEKACGQLAYWKALGLPLVPVSINVSARQFNHGNIKNLFASALSRHSINPELVEIELTESSMMGEQSEVVEQLAAIRALGIKLLVDDFGTGFSSLAQLQRLNMDALKVDRTFTAELVRTTEGEIFFKAIVSMAHSLGMSVIAEGVETGGQLSLLQSLSCDEIQGYLIARPVPAQEVEELLKKRFLLGDMA